MLSLERPACNQYGTSLGYSYSVAQVQAALIAPTRVMYYRYKLLDLNMNFKKWLGQNVTSASISMDTTQQVMRSADITLTEDPAINYLSDRIQPFAFLQMPDGNFATFPLGVFLLTTPPRQTDSSQVVTREITGYDLTQILVDMKTEDRYTIAVGTNYIAAIRSLLSAAGITQMNLTATSLTLPTALDWEGGTAYIDIINQLLAAINYYNLWFDSSGVAQAQPYISPSVLPPAYTYKDDSTSVMTPEVNQNLDLFSVPNKWILVVSQSDTAAIVSTYTNDNPNSPTSTVNRGRTIVSYDDTSTAPTQAINDALVAKQAYQDSQVYETEVFETLVMPMHEAFDVIQFEYSVLGVTDKFNEIGWSMNLAAGDTMSHTIQRVVQV
ncbi:hypothetical protein [Alicyclobacillus fastidiosus]|uniref:Virion structural protein n=1 Tax=Alicyclobacillus fastidiosus TaxID=392011 RepID=A0ABV5AKF4_9BACL|nr:hypothetical protein [Alicyclobacillus fastidiosus]WEH09262.1 hypothetical protein PYS47_21735 [Alicyclobacillus fastidiosus]